MFFPTTSHTSRPTPSEEAGAPGKPEATQPVFPSPPGCQPQIPRLRVSAAWASTQSPAPRLLAAGWTLSPCVYIPP